MSADPIRQLLVDADGVAPQPAAVTGLADRVRRRHAKRVIVARSTVAAVACLLLVAIPLIVSQRRSAHRTTISEFARAELLRLDEVAQHHARAADALLRIERASKPRVRIDEPESWIQRERAEAALAMLRCADRLYAANRDPVAAAAAYRRAIRLFPDTPAAEAATQRLERIPI